MIHSQQNPTIHLSRLSIERPAIAYIDWGSNVGLTVYFLGGEESPSLFIDDPEDIKTLARELKRPGFSRL